MDDAGGFVVCVEGHVLAGPVAWDVHSGLVAAQVATVPAQGAGAELVEPDHVAPLRFVIFHPANPQVRSGSNGKIAQRSEKLEDCKHTRGAGSGAMERSGPS